jgi:hypothetical protein
MQAQHTETEGVEFRWHTLLLLCAKLLSIISCVIFCRMLLGYLFYARILILVIIVDKSRVGVGLSLEAQLVLDKAWFELGSA